MRLEILTLPFDPARGGFDVRALQHLQRDSRVTSCREHFFEAGGRPWLTVVAECVPAAACTRAASPPVHAGFTGATPTGTALGDTAPGHSAAAAMPADDLAPVDAPAPDTPTAARSEPAGARRPSASVAIEFLPPEHRALFEHLRRWRFDTAKRAGVPPYVVLTNRQLLEVITKHPTSKGALAKIPGVGRKTVERHGETLGPLAVPPQLRARRAADRSPGIHGARLRSAPCCPSEGVANGGHA